MNDTLSFGDLSRVFARTTEFAALKSWHWIGRENREVAIAEINQTMIQALDGLPVDAKAIYWGEQQDTEIKNGSKVGADGSGMIVDIVVNPVENRSAMHSAGPGSVSVIGAAPGGTIRNIGPAEYMDMMVVGSHSSENVHPDNTIEQNVGIVAEALNKPVTELLVFVLDIPQNEGLREELHRIGCRVRFRKQGDLLGAICAADEYREVDLFLGVAKAHQSLLIATAVNGLQGGMYARCAPNSDEEREALEGTDIYKAGWMSNRDLVASKWTIFCATGITDNTIVQGVDIRQRRFETQTMVIGGENAYQRVVSTRHRKHVVGD